MGQKGNLATEYRPQSFSEVVGQETAIQVLKRLASAPGIAARSVLLKGSYGSGKTTLARIFGKALNCESISSTGDVCGVCSGCQEAAASNSQTYWELDATSVGNVEGIRNLSERLTVAPRGRRLITVDEIHAASASALNALLKLVEEGVPNTMFMFCTTEEILPTLKSRSICVDITTIPFDLVRSHVGRIAASRGTEISESDLGIIAMKSGGHMRDALTLLHFYEMAGASALQSSYFCFRDFIVNTLSSTPQKDPHVVLEELLHFPIADIKMSLGLFIQNVFTAAEGTLEARLNKGGVGHTLFSYFFAPHAQQALRSESGVNILLHAFLDTVLRKRAARQG